MTAHAEPLRITRPGVYDLPPEVYHGDPVPGGSISSSGVRGEYGILAPGCPEKFRYLADHPEERKVSKVFDFGHAAHRLILGAGAELVVIDAANYNRKAAQAARDEARAADKIPLLAPEHEKALAMEAALRAHPYAGALFEPGTGRAEQSLFWLDQRHGVWRRAMLDWLRERDTEGRLLVPDYKTIRCAHPDALARAMADHHYEQQAAWNEDAVTALGLHGGQEPVFLLVFQEKTPPYLITIAMPKASAIIIGRDRNEAALEIFKRCQNSGHWPGYSETVVELEMPRYAEFSHYAELARGDFETEGTR